MKVLFTFGGLPHYYNAILNKLNSEGNIEVHVAVPQSNHNTLGKGVYQTDEGIDFKLHYLEEYNTYYGKPFLRGFLKLMIDERPDILVIIWPYILSLIFKPHIYLFLKLMGIKIIFKEIPFQVPKFNESKEFYRSGKLVDENLQDQAKSSTFIGRLRYNVLPYIMKAYYKLVDANVDYIEDAYEIVGSYGIEKEKIFIIYNSPDTDEILKIKKEISGMPPLLQDNDYRLIHVGRLVKWKKVDLLIKAFAAVKEKYPDAELIIIGKGPEEEPLKRLAGSLNLIDSIKFIGGVYNSTTLGRYISASSVYVLAGMGGLSINEAMCYDKPVICSVCDGTEKKLVRDDYNGKFFKEDSTNDLSNKIDYFFSDIERMHAMGKNSGRIITGEINVDTVIKGYLSAFGYVLKK